MTAIKGTWESHKVELDGKPLDPRPSQNIRNHSPDGFMWSYGGSGPAQLALAILLSVVTKEEAVKWYQAFKWEFVSRWPADDFTVQVDIQAWINKKEEREDEVAERQNKE